MSLDTAIEWATATWNPTTGCTKVSEGCEHCYITRTPPFRMNGRRFEGPNGPDAIGATTGVEIHAARLEWPFRWTKPERVFVNSLSDLFHQDVPVDFIVQVFAVMGLTPRHTYMVLTKRPGPMASLLSDPEFGHQVYLTASAIVGYRGDTEEDNLAIVTNVLDDENETMRDFLPNVWLGTSVENQKWADVRVPKLLEVPAAAHFLSCEPLLGPVDLRHVPIPLHGPRDVAINQLDWVIVGGESGLAARPMHPDWARWLRDQCVVAGVPFFFKQHGEWRYYLYPDSDGLPEPGVWLARDGRTADEAEALEGGDWTGMYRLGKHRAGRLLDGRTWDEMPAAVQAVST